MQGAYYMQGTVNGHQPVGAPHHGPPHVQSHFSSPAQGVPHYMMSPGQHQHHAVPQSPVVDCWGLPGWFPFASTAHTLSAPVNRPAMHEGMLAYDALIKNDVGKLMESCNKFGDPVAAYGLAIHLAFKAQRDMIAKALSIRRADAKEMTKMLAPTEAALTKLETLKQAGCDEHADFRYHLQMLCGASSALGWVTTADPKGYVSDALNAVPVFARKILESESAESKLAALGDELITNLKSLLRSLKDYCDKFHHTGLTWAPEPTKAAKAEAAAKGSLSTDTEKQGYAGTAMVNEFDSILRDKVVPVIETCYVLGDEVIVAADCIQRAFKAQRDMLLLATRHTQPSEEVLEKVLAETSAVLCELAELEEDCEGKECAHVIKLLVNGMSALAWVSVEHPVVFVSEVVSSLPVFGDKIQSLAKRRSADLEDQEANAQAELVSRFKEVIRSILQYVKARHPQGVSWNPDGKPLTKFPL